MTKQQKTIKSNAQNKAAKIEIFKTMDLLVSQVRDYEKLMRTHKASYTAKNQLLEIANEVAFLKLRLQDIH